MTHLQEDWVAKSRNLKCSVKDFIGDQWRTGSGEQQIRKNAPRDGKLLYQFESGEHDNLDAAVSVARCAFDRGHWSAAAAGERKKKLHELANLIDQHQSELALLECLDTGKPISDTLTIDLPMTSALVRVAAEGVDRLTGTVYGVGPTHLSYSLHRPIGVVGAIVGWNFPLVLAASKIGPALAMGNSLVLKPSELTSLATARLAQLACEAGVPSGVFNVVHGAGTIGTAIGLHRGIDLITFTGSTATGKKLLQASGQSNMKRLILECGGKAANIVFADCPDLDAVADAIVSRAFWNQGQVCTASSRLLVQESVKDALMARISERAAALEPGDPLNPQTKFGALVSEAHLQKVQAYVETGLKEGGRIIQPQPFTPPFVSGFYQGPTIFDQVSTDHRIAQEEIFGPVLSVISFVDETEAVRIANDTIYGLSAILWTKDLARAHRLSYRIRVGWMTVNACAHPKGGPGAGVIPIAGLKESGLGSEGGLEGLAHYTETTTVQQFV
jgi:acyl-CoA reductase-like NAD-dependent aldehyde dehydrogenase